MKLQRDAKARVVAQLASGQQVSAALCADRALHDEIVAVAALVARALGRGRTVYLAGNGGSAADAQHLAAELQGQLYRKGRRPLPVLALTANAPLLTALANDYGYEHTFARQLTAHARRGDVLIAMSTSGRSPNILAVARAAQKLGVAIVGFTGTQGQTLRRLCDRCIVAPSSDVARIQECHLQIGHILCELVEAAIPAIDAK